MAVTLTFAAQLGSDGAAIARRIADSLRFSYFDREVILQAAGEVGVSPATVADSERWHSLSERLLEGLSQSAVLPTGTVTPMAYGYPELRMTSVDYRHLIEEVVKGLGERGGCVILGHAGQIILKDQGPRVFRTLIRGSLEARCRRLAWQENITVQAARALIDESDERRAQLFRHVYNVDVMDSSLYDFMLNTDVIDSDTAVQCILEAVAGNS